MNPSLVKWLRTSFFSLLLVAFLGVVMRYKIVYSLPWVDQRNLLHAHSHFAFAGWITQALMSLLVSYLFAQGDTSAFSRYRFILYANLATAYGMLLTFPFMGYAFLSIVFSTLSIFVSYWFAVKFWKDLNALQRKEPAHRWFKAAVLFNALASLGAFTLAYMLATKNIHPNTYLASVYFFLHFQYNGWFFFACMGLLSYQLYKYGVAENKLQWIYRFFVIACVPAYFLSALWLPIAKWLYILIVLAVLLQLAGWVLTIQLVKRTWPLFKQSIGTFAKTLFVLCAVAVTIKLLLQAGSVIPSLSRLAFGFRPIVIGYLHLVLLGIITIFIIAYCIAYRFIVCNQTTKTGIVIFISGIIINEILLMTQGIADLNYQPVPSINLLLLLAALILLAGIAVINAGQFFPRYDSAHKTRENK